MGEDIGEERGEDMGEDMGEDRGEDIERIELGDMDPSSSDW